MEGLKISEAARVTGFSESALRFYEDQGVVIPDRASNGYRSYSPGSIESLRFVARAKQLGLSLEQTRELLSLLERKECQPVQTRILALVTERISQLKDQIADLVTFTARLHLTANTLSDHTADGACSDDCGCLSDVATTSPIEPNAELACTLEPVLMADRLDDWKSLLSRSVAAERVRDGYKFTFGPEVDVALIASLAGNERVCCAFLHFTIRIETGSVSLSITGPDHAQDLLDSLVGSVGKSPDLRTEARQPSPALSR